MVNKSTSTGKDIDCIGDRQANQMREIASIFFGDPENQRKFREWQQKQATATV